MVIFLFTLYIVFMCVYLCVCDENTPIQIKYNQFYNQNGNISDKNSYIFRISAQNIDCGEAVLTSTHNLSFLAKQEK